MAGGTRTDPVLITGCSSGIGRAAAVGLHQAGLRVYATARRVDTLADLASRGIATMALDVTDEASMAAAVAAVEAGAGAVGTLINNAGYGLYGPVEQVPMTEVRRQFETNFFGLVRLTQHVLPGMRERRAAVSSTSPRWAAGPPCPAGPSITRPSTRSRRSATRSGWRSPSSASRSC